MAADALLRPADEDGYIIAWRCKYKFETGRMEGTMTYAEAAKKCAELCAEDSEKTFWPQRSLDTDATSYGKFHKAH